MLYDTNKAPIQKARQSMIRLAALLQDRERYTEPQKPVKQEGLWFAAMG